MVREMQSVKIPKFQRLRGEEAIKALDEFIAELEEQRGKELTDKQTNALIKLAKGLMASIKIETRSITSRKEIADAHEMNPEDLLRWKCFSVSKRQFQRTLL